MVIELPQNDNAWLHMMLHDVTVQLDNEANKVLFMTLEVKVKGAKWKEILYVFTL